MSPSQNSFLQVLSFSRLDVVTDHWCVTLFDLNTYHISAIPLKAEVTTYLSGLTTCICPPCDSCGPVLGPESYGVIRFAHETPTVFLLCPIIQRLEQILFARLYIHFFLRINLFPSEGTMPSESNDASSPKVTRGQSNRTGGHGVRRHHAVGEDTVEDAVVVTRPGSSGT